MMLRNVTVSKETTFDWTVSEPLPRTLPWDLLTVTNVVDIVALA